MDMRERMSVEVSGRRVAYLRAGSGPALLLLHGIGGNAEQFRNQLDGLADAFDVLAWDAPGYGASDDPGPDWTIGDYVAAAVGLLDALGLERAHLLGQSWGGVIAQEVCRRHAARLRSLVLADTFTGGGAQSAAERAAGLQARLTALERMTPAEMARARTPAVLGPAPTAEVMAEVEAMMAQIRPTGYRQAAIAIADADTRDVLPNVRVPALIMAGEHDQVVPHSAAEYLRDYIPGARLVTFDAGHLPAQEQPAAFNAALRAFLADVP